MNTISFEVNNQRKMKLMQRQHDGATLLVIEDQHGDHESIPDEEAFISPGDFVMLINYYRACRREGKPILRGGEHRERRNHPRRPLVSAGPVLRI